MSSTFTVTTREKIVEYILDTLGSLQNITHVERRLPSYERLQEFAETQFPVVAVVAGLPVPVEKISPRGGKGVIDLVISQMDVELFVYLMDNENADASISDLLSSIWAALLTDESQGDLVLGTKLLPERASEYFQPYVAFKVTVSMKYVHNKGGI